MKRVPLASLLKTLCLLAALPMFSGCSFYVWAFMRNTSDSSVLVKLAWRYPQARTGFLPYSPQLLAPNYKSVGLLRDSLPTTATREAIVFRLPPHSTVLVDGGANHFQPIKELRLQRVDSSVQVLDSVQLTKKVQFSMRGGAHLWYDIKADSI